MILRVSLTWIYSVRMKSSTYLRAVNVVRLILFYLSGDVNLKMGCWGVLKDHHASLRSRTGPQGEPFSGFSYQKAAGSSVAFMKTSQGTELKYSGASVKKTLSLCVTCLIISSLHDMQIILLFEPSLFVISTHCFLLTAQAAVCASARPCVFSILLHKAAVRTGLYACWIRN